MVELFKKYRPKKLADVRGNKATVAALENMIAKGKVPHAILLHGPKGCGKTTLARIVAKSLGCKGIDLFEMNSASYRGIDTVREMEQSTHRAAAKTGGKRVYVLDEVHKLSNDAQTALLKTVEEPPRHVYFILCTTDPEKLLGTLCDRCTKLPVAPLRAGDGDEAESLIMHVAAREGIKLDQATIEGIVDGAGGSARAMLVALEYVAHLPPEQRAKAAASAAETQQEAIDLCRVICKGTPTWKRVAAILRNLKSEPETTRWAVLTYAQKMLLSTGDYHYYNVILAFGNNFYDSKAAGLAAACYEACNAGNPHA